ncbi:MAG: hypothetical protein V1887_03080 [Candidatus Aenigmatarchaeota archaeon]
MMQITTVLIVAVLLLGAPVLAVNEGGQQAGPQEGQGDGNSTDMTGQEDEGSGAPVVVAPAQIRERVTARNETELRSMIAERREALNNEIAGLRTELREMEENRNRVRLAVHALLAMENLTGGIGKDVSTIAREFNNSVRTREQQEERIQNRNGIMRVLLGGDEVAAEQLAQDLNMTQERLQQLRTLRERCECSAEVKAIIQEQIQEMEQEQTRLRLLVNNEKADIGLFGWLWKRD